MSKGLKRIFIYVLAGLVAIGLASFALGWIVGHQEARGVAVDANRTVLLIMGPVAVAAMIGAMAITVAWMRSIDEAAREAHKSAWFWGGCGGMAVGGVFVILASLPPVAAVAVPSVFPGRTDPAAYAATGAAALSLLMTAGYTLAWAWWWWKRR